MPQIVPFVPSEPHLEFWSVIDGLPCLFEQYWNASDSAWYFHLYDQDERRIAAGVKIVLGVHLARRVIHDLTRRGCFVAEDLSGGGKSGRVREAAFDDLGTRVQVRHYTVAEMVAAMQARE